MMKITAVFPIRTDQNPFWSSPKGLSCIESFLASYRRIQGIDRFVINTHEDKIFSLAKKYEMATEKNVIPGTIETPFTFAQSRIFVENFLPVESSVSNAVIVADHRNLFLKPEDIGRVLDSFRRAPDAGVITLALCRDFPCQYNSFYHFLGSAVLKFGTFENAGKQDEDSTDHLRMNCNDYGELSITCSVQPSSLRISLNSDIQELAKYVVRLVPFDDSGLQYHDYHEFFVPEPRFNTKIDFTTPSPEGLVFFLSMPSKTGEYDAVEIFTPPGASWRLNSKGGGIVDAETFEAIFGRQQFPELYTYDGSVCIFTSNSLSGRNDASPGFILLDDTCFVTNWVQYLRCVI